MSTNKINDWQSQQIKDFREMLLECKTIEELVKVSRNLIYFSHQAWYLRGCMPAYAKRLADLREGVPGRIIVIIDLKAIAHLAYCRAKGTDPAIEFASILKNIKAAFPKSPLMVFADESETGGHRYKIDSRWKSKRTEPDKGFIPFMNRVREALDKRGAKRYLFEGWEADDVIASLASSYALAGDKCVAICQDKDLYQILSPQLTMFWKGAFFNRESLMKKYAVEPGMWVDWLSLVGKNDIPGASGIGEITASKLLITFGSYINCLNAIQQVQSQFSDNIAKSLIEFEEQYFGVVKLHRLERTLEVEVVV